MFSLTTVYQLVKEVVLGGAVGVVVPVFHITITGPSYPSGNTKTFTVGNYTQTWNNLIPGNYTVTEAALGSEWSVTVPASAVPVLAGQTATATVINTYIPPQCETAWAFGPRYVSKGNWATYTPYVANSTVQIYAGQTIPVGTVHFSGVVAGKVMITINLTDGWKFETVNQNLKIQDYVSAQTRTPSPGLFQHKFTTTGTTIAVEVPNNNFYGIHLNVCK